MCITICTEKSKTNKIWINVWFKAKTSLVITETSSKHCSFIDHQRVVVLTKGRLLLALNRFWWFIWCILILSVPPSPRSWFSVLSVGHQTAPDRKPHCYSTERCQLRETQNSDVVLRTKYGEENGNMTTLHAQDLFAIGCQFGTNEDR